MSPPGRPKGEFRSAQHEDTPIIVVAGRLRLWELDVECHGPLLGSCWSAAEFRRLSDKLFDARSRFDDFELHMAAAAQCATRNRLSLALQRELDRSAAPWLRRAAAAATTQELHALWCEALHAGEVGPALWAVWGDARCDEALRATLHKDLYLLQHQRIAHWPAERAAGRALQAEQQALRAEQQLVQQRQARWRSEALAERDALRAQLASAREHAAALQAQLDRLRQAAPAPAELPAGRAALVQQVAALTLQLAQLQRAGEAPPAPVPAAAPVVPELDDAAATPPLTADALRATRVLCVGGRSHHVPMYRDLVERHGGRFTHHDGGIEDNPHRLDAQLASADLVLCQSGCLNHNAYSRVKDHCKRSGKPCVYLDKPGAGSFARALSEAAVLGC